MPNPTRARPATESDALERAHLEETRDRLEIALEASGMGIFDLDLATMSARTTMRHNEIFGYTQPVEAWSPTIFKEHVVSEDRPLVDAAFETAMETGDFDLTARVRWPDGSVHWMRDWGRVYRDDEGRPVRLVGVTEDVTEAKRVEEELRRAKEEAEEASQARGRFLAVMSHELRTPLTGIIGSADVLALELGEDGPARAQTGITRIRSTAWHMVTLIDDLLALARSEAGKEELRVADADIARIARDVSGILTTQADAKGLTLRLDGLDGEAPLRTDPGKVRQILMNLAGNAIKYTRDGEVAVRVSATGEGGAVVTVTDTGPGIAPEDRERIFEPFAQLNATGGVAGGTGLGLAIARRLARLLGGDIELESEVGGGSTFTLRLPSMDPES